MIHFVAPRDQAFGIQDYLATWGEGLSGRLTVLHYEELPGRETTPAGTYIFSALDQLTETGRRVVGELQACLEAPGSGCRVLNHLSAVRLRLDLLEELHRLGLNRHRAVRATGDLSGLRFPVFLHEELRHTGALSPLISSPSELNRALGKAVLQGFRPADLLVVEFCDTSDALGNYRKYAAYRVGPDIIARTMGKGRHWMLKADRVEFSMEMLLEERSFVLENPYREPVRRIFELAGIEYGRIDFSLLDGRVETWEINTNPSVGPSRQKVMPDEFASVRQPIRDHFRARFDEALVGLDDVEKRDPIPVALSPESRRPPGPLVLPPFRPREAVRLVHRLGPLNPVLKGVADLLSPLVGRVALWRR